MFLLIIALLTNLSLYSLGKIWKIRVGCQRNQPHDQRVGTLKPLWVGDGLGTELIISGQRF